MTLLQKLLFHLWGVKPRPKEPLRPGGVIRGENPEVDYHGIPYRPN